MFYGNNGANPWHLIFMNNTRSSEGLTVSNKLLVEGNDESCPEAITQ